MTSIHYSCAASHQWPVYESSQAIHLGNYSIPRKTLEHPSSRRGMVRDEVLVWSSLSLLVLGYCFHRMGPAFNRSRFGPPLALLGISCLILFPEGMDGPEEDAYNSVMDFLSWGILFIIGAKLILIGAPTYGKKSPIGMIAGWIFVGLSGYLLLEFEDSFSTSEVADGLWASLGLFSVLLVFIFGVTLAERISGQDVESDPLSEKESLLVGSILERRLGGE